MSAGMAVGDAVTATRTFTQDDFDRFAALTGDDNPIHVDPAFAAQTEFGRPVAHGMFLFSQLWGLITTRFPTPHSIELSAVNLVFPAPTFADEEVTLRAEVVEALAGNWTFAVTVSRPDHMAGLEGAIVTFAPYAARWTPLSWDWETEERTPFSGLRIGQRAELAHTFAADEVADYLRLSADGRRSRSLDADTATGGLEGSSLPAPLLGGLFSRLLGTQLPGRGTNWLKQFLSFPGPAGSVGEPLTAAVEVMRLRPEKDLVDLRTTCTNSAGELICDGRALVLVRDLEATEMQQPQRAADAPAEEVVDP